MMLGIYFNIGQAPVWAKVSWAIFSCVATITGVAMVVFRPQYDAWRSQKQ